MAGSAPSDKVKDKEYSNWLKVTLALYYMKSGLHTFMQSEVGYLHQSLIQKIYGGKTVPLPPCTMCHAHFVHRNKYSGVWTFQKQCKSYCDVWLYELLALHTNPKSEKIYWDNSHVASWPFKPWECAKVFMPRGQLPSNVGPAECDAQAMLTLLTNCIHFHHRLSPQGLGLTHTISTIRNKVMHDGEMKLSDADRVTYIQQIIQFLEDSVILKSIEDCKAAVGNIQKINNDFLDVSFNLDIEMKGLRSAVNELRMELGMQEKRTLDTVDSLKEDYEQLREQLTNTFSDVENRMDFIEKSVNEQMDSALKQQEEHQEMQATVAHMSADVTSHRARLDTVEENVEIIHNRTDTIERSVQSIKEQKDMALQQQEKRHQELHTTVTWDRVRLGTVEKNMQYFGTELQELKANILTQKGNNSGMERKAAVEGIIDYRTSEAPVKQRPVSDGLRQLKSQTEDKLETIKRLGFITTTQVEEAKKLLERNRSVVIKGNPGEGKTTAAVHLIDNEIYSDRRVVVYSPDDWKAVDTHWVDIVILEDILGQFDLDLGRLQEWLVYLPTIQEHVDAGKLQVIITTRTDILSKAHYKLGSIRLFSDDLSMTLSSEHLKYSEMMSILNRELQRHKRNMNGDEKEKCISNFRGLIGFPQCCSLFAGDINLFNRGSEFFKSPAKLFVENIAKLEDTRFLSLAFLFCNGRILEEYLSPETMPESRKQILVQLVSHLHISERKTAISLLRDVYEKFLGLYVVMSISDHFSFNCWTSKPCYMLSHPIVYEAVGQVLGDRCIEIVVKYADSAYLYQRTYTAEAKDRTSQNAFIPASVYGLLAERMVQDIVDKRLVKSVVKHSAFKLCQFLMRLKDEIQKSDKVKAFFFNSSQTFFLGFLDSMFSLNQNLIEGECITFLQNILRSDEDVVTIVYSQLFAFLACKHNNNSAGCWQCKEKQNLLELALYYHHFEIADKLIAMNACYTYTSLCNAARHGDLRRVLTIIKTLKRRLVFSPVCGVAKDALCRAYITGHKDVIEFFVNEGITLDIRHVVDVVREGDVNVLVKVIEHFKFHNNWNPHMEKHWSFHKNWNPHLEKHWTHGNILHLLLHSDKVMRNPCSTALCIAYCNDKFDMVYYLVQNGVVVSMYLLLSVLISGSQKAVSRLIETLKDTGALDSNWYLASVALEIAYSTQKYDVCDTLIQVGFSLTMKNLPCVINRSEASFESVKKAIQHLKDNSRFDPKCYYASKALRKAYNLRMYDVCDLLIQAGISITMKHLPHVILRPLDHVKTAVDKLKGSANWDPKCDYASEALKYTFSKHKHDVCDLLVQEGVTLTMKNLAFFFTERFQVSFESAKKAIQHLKDTYNWDPKCDNASKALEEACTLKQFDLLVQAGVSLQMKSLPSVVHQFHVSFEHVKLAIQHLKDNDNWDPKHDGALKALSRAYWDLKYDVCSLLVQEGVPLTMVYFPFVIKTYETSEALKKTIQYLKDTDEWDPECYYASEALTSSFVLEKYNMSDLLIHEEVPSTFEIVHDVIRGRFEASCDSVKKTIQHMKDTNIWDPKFDYASEALEIAYRKEKYDVFDLLVQEGVSLTMKNLPGFIYEAKTVVSVKKVIQQLKHTGNWNPRCVDACVALENAYSQQNYDVCDLLVQEGVSSAMSNLVVITNKLQISFEPVKKAIQHLKDRKIWDPDCVDASEALANAYGQQKFDVCDLLVQEGVSPTMKNLLLVRYESETLFETVEKIIQHLKDTDNWHPEYDDASEALENAYRQQKYNVCDLLAQEGVKLMMKNLPGVCKYPSSFVSVKKAMQHLKDTDNWDPTCDDASKAVGNAYGHQMYDVCDLFFQEGVSLTMKNLCDVSCKLQSSFESFTKAIQHLKETDNWNPKCDDAFNTLTYAYISQKYDVCHLLVQEGVSLTMKNLLSLVLFGKWEHNVKYSARRMIQHLKDTDSWDPKCDDASQALKHAYTHRWYDVLNLLVQQGVSLAMMYFPGVVLGSRISMETIKKTIQYFKDTDNWDPTCVDACKALENAYRNNRYDVCDLLVKEGVSLTMKNLPGSSIFPISFKYVEKVMQHLKETGNWDPKCSDASEALLIAYILHKYNICDLLLQEGVLPTMTILPAVIYKCRRSFDSVKTTVQLLKDTCIWDPKCDDASKALGIAYGQHEYNVCDLLLHEGVSLTMKNLPDVILGTRTSLESVKKAIQLLKDTCIWDPKCDDASKALGIAYGQHEYDVCDLLLQEGVSLTMKNLPDVILGTRTSLESVKKAIQLLKDTCIWDPKCDDASKALGIAYGQHEYDVCDLLLQEGVSLTMKNLPDVILGTRTSLESVKKAIQHLKDTNNWDPSCDDASESLKNAYSKHSHYIYAMLLQEGVSLIK